MVLISGKWYVAPIELNGGAMLHFLWLFLKRNTHISGII